MITLRMASAQKWLLSFTLFDHETTLTTWFWKARDIARPQVFFWGLRKGYIRPLYLCWRELKNVAGGVYTTGNWVFLHGPSNSDLARSAPSYAVKSWHKPVCMSLELWLTHWMINLKVTTVWQVFKHWVLPTCKKIGLYVYEKVRALTGVSRAEDQKYVFEHRVNDNTKTLSQITCTLEWPGTFWTFSGQLPKLTAWYWLSFLANAIPQLIYGYT